MKQIFITLTSLFVSCVLIDQQTAFAALEIVGNKNMEAGASQVFSIAAPEPDTTYTWTLTGPGKVDSFTANSVTISAPPSASNTYPSLSATPNGDGGGSFGDSVPSGRVPLNYYDPGVVNNPYVTIVQSGCTGDPCNGGYLACCWSGSIFMCDGSTQPDVPPVHLYQACCGYNSTIGSCDRSAAFFAENYPAYHGTGSCSPILPGKTPPPPEKDLGKPPLCPTPQFQGNPINIFNGNKYEPATDLRFATSHKQGLAFSRYFNSQSSSSSMLGYGWSHSFAEQLTANVIMDGTTYIRVMQASGKGYYFTESDTNRWTGAFKEKSYIIVEADGSYSWYRSGYSTYNFTSSGQLQWIDDDHGNRQSFTYDATGKLQAVFDQASGISLTFHYRTDNSTLLDHISGPVTAAVGDGIWLTYNYDTNNNLISVTNPDSSGFDYEYDDANDIHNLTAKKDKMGHLLTSWSYDEYDRAYASESVNAEDTVYIEYVNVNTVDVTDAYDVTRSHTIKKKDFYYPVITEISNNSGCQSCGGTPQPIRYEYDDNRNVTEKEYANGRLIQYADFDDRGNPGTIIKNAGTSEQQTFYYTYHPETGARLSVSTKSLLNPDDYKTTIWDYDNDTNTIPNENPTRNVYRKIDSGYTMDVNQQIVSYEFITRYTYNVAGQITSINGPLPGDDDLTSLTYDPATGNRLSITRPLIGTTTLADYDAVGNPQLITDPNGIQTTLVYDARNRIISTTTNGVTTTRTYNLAGNLATVTDAMGRSITYGYDPEYGRLTTVTDDMGNYQQNGYDAQGNTIEVTANDSDGIRHKRSRYNYQHPSQPGKLWKVIGHDDTETAYDYDEMGNISTITDPLGRVYSYDYNLAGQQTSTSEPSEVVTNFGYDQHGNLISVIDAENKETTYRVDDLGRVLSSTSPDAGIITYTYNEAGQLASKTDAMDVTTSYSYDIAGRRTGIFYADSSQDVIFTYDQGLYAQGRLSAISGPDASIQFIFAVDGSLSEEVKTMAGVEYTTSYVYDDTGLVTDIAYPWGLTLHYSYNTLGQVLGITLTDPNNTSTDLVSNASYKPFGPLTGLTLGNGIQISRTYDESYRLTRINDTAILDLSYGFDLGGGITSIINNIDPSNNQVFTYDDNDHLLTAQGVYGSLSYTYDKVGNRQTKSQDGITETYSYIAETNRIKTISKGSEQKIFIHDKAGRIISLPDKDQTQPPETSYSYNHRELRIKKAQLENTIIYHYDRSGNLLAETKPDGSLLQAYIYGIGMRIATVIPENGGYGIYYHHNNHLGTPQKLTDTTGLVVWQAAYLPFGQAVVDQSSTMVNNMRFAGQYYDSETGLHYNWHRYYDPGTGRYMTPDPIGLAGGINLYAYVSGDPVNRVDPDGRKDDFVDLFKKIKDAKGKLDSSKSCYSFIKNGGCSDCESCCNSLTPGGYLTSVYRSNCGFACAQDEARDNFRDMLKQVKPTDGESQNN